MEVTNLLTFTSRSQLWAWLEANHMRTMCIQEDVTYRALKSKVEGMRK